ncbi:MAG: MBL fold metallo-hydrolase, partial [Woeseiaceae bacterium]
MSAELRPGIVTRLGPGLRRIVAPNPGLMTGPGTNSWLLGETQVAVIDPGPDIATHVETIVRAAGGVIRWILVTHTHPDHSPAAARLAAATGAEQLGRAAPAGRHQDAT